MWNSYSKDDIVVAYIIFTLVMDLRTLVMPLIFFKFVENHFSNRVIWKFGFK
jgi:hypothetical protein